MIEPDRQRLLAQLERALRACPGPTCVARAEAPLEDVEPAAWLEAQEGPHKIYWANRDGAFETAGVGVAHCAAAEGRLDVAKLFAGLRGNLTPSAPDLRYYGGMAFDTASPCEGPWRAFGASRFVLPRVEVVRTQSRNYLACNALLAEQGRVDEELSAAKATLEGIAFDRLADPGPVPEAGSRRDLPERDAWDRLVEDALERMTAGALEKVVLARECRFELAGALDPAAVLRRVKATGADAYLFCFQPTPSEAFFGVSPERLYRCDGGDVQGEALAGTRRRGASPESDAALGEELLHSDKDLREHRFVMESIRSALDKLCRGVRCDEAVSLVKLPNCQHLLWRCAGRLAEGRTDADVLAALHPTPAVGGYPAQDACAWIRASEPFARGWYAGPVGWVGHDSSEFAIGIRSGLASGRELRLYSGAGIVAGATAEQEWAEIEAKMSGLLEALAYDGE